MKKLIEELEKERAHHAQYQASAYDCGRLSGFDDALYIVRAHNPWHEVSELPLIDTSIEKISRYSVDVLVMLNDYIDLGYYDCVTENWYNADGDKISTPTHWAYLPEVK